MFANTFRTKKHYICNYNNAVCECNDLKDYDLVYSVLDIKAEALRYEYINCPLGTKYYSYSRETMNNVPVVVTIPSGSEIYVYNTDLDGVVLLQYKKYHHSESKYKCEGNYDYYKKCNYAYATKDAVSKCCIHDTHGIGSYMIIDGPSGSAKWYIKWSTTTRSNKEEPLYNSSNTFEYTLKLIHLFKAYPQEVIDSFGSELFKIVEHYQEAMVDFTQYCMNRVFYDTASDIDSLIQKISKNNQKIAINYLMPDDILKKQIEEKERKMKIEEEFRKENQRKLKAFLSKIENRKELMKFYNEI